MPIASTDDPSVGCSGREDVADPTPEKAVARILQLAPLGTYAGATPEGANCSLTVSKIQQLGKVDNVRVVITWLPGCAKQTCTSNPQYALNFDVYAAASNLPNQRDYAFEIPVTAWKGGNGALSFTVSYGARNVANVELSNVMTMGSIKSTFTEPNAGTDGAVMECRDLVAVASSVGRDAQ